MSAIVLKRVAALRTARNVSDVNCFVLPPVILFALTIRIAPALGP